MSDIVVTLIVFGIILILNAISLICMRFTEVGKYFYKDYSKTTKEAVVINIYMMCVGVAFWIMVLYIRLKYGKVWKNIKNKNKIF